MPSAILGPVLGSVAGGLVSRGGGGGQTSSNEPWKPVQEWLTQQIPIGQQLQDYYQQNPFNPQQQEAYNNIFADQANFRQNIAPNLMGFANQLMGTQYSRAPNMFERGSVNGRTGRHPAGLLGGGAPQMPQGSASTRPTQYEPTVTQPSGGAFTMPFAGAGGNTNPTGAGIDFNAQNPFYKPPGQEKPPTDEQTIQQLIDEEMRRRDDARRQAEYYFDSGN